MQLVLQNTNIDWYFMNTNHTSLSDWHPKETDDTWEDFSKAIFVMCHLKKKVNCSYRHFYNST